MKAAILVATVLTTVAVAGVSPTRATQSNVRGLTLQGRVVSSITREPLRAVRVFDLNLAPKNEGPSDIEFLSGPDGRFVFHDLEPGIYALNAVKAGYVEYTSTRISIAPGDTDRTIELAMTPEAVISGTVTDETGEPRPGVTIRAWKPTERPANFRSQPSGFTHADGRYSLGGLEAAEYVLGMLSQGGSPVEETQPIAVKAGEERAGVDFLLHDDLPQLFDRPSGTHPSDSTATIAGFVRDQNGRGLSRVQLGLSNDEDRSNRGWNRHAATDTSGRFRFDDVLPGRYRLTPTRADFEIPNRDWLPGQVVEVSAGQSISNTVVTMTKLSTLTGTIRDQYGDPVAAPVTVEEIAGDVRRINETVADSRGRYSLSRLRSGEYLVALAQRSLGHSVRTFDDSGVERTIGYRTMYHPGVTQQSLATQLTMSGGDVAGFDLVLRPVFASTIEVSLDWGKRARGDAELQVIDLTDTSDDDDAMFSSAFHTARRFKKTVPAAATGTTVHGITAGRYLLIASAPEPNTDGSGAKKLRARQEVQSDGLIPVSIHLPLDAAARVTGRAVFDGPSAAPQTFRATLQPVPGLDFPMTVPVRGDGTREIPFAIDDVMPGRYRLGATAFQSGSVSQWTLARATAGGRDIFDLTIDLPAGGELADVVLTFADRASRSDVSGSVADTSGRPVPNGAVLVFAADERYWRNRSRHIRLALSDSQGRYTIADLPAGDYRAVYLPYTTDYLPLLPSLLPRAVAFTLREGEHKTVDVKR